MGIGGRSDGKGGEGRRGEKLIHYLSNNINADTCIVTT